MAREVAFKVRDTVAGIVGAWRSGADDDKWERLALALTGRSKTLKVVLWLDRDPLSSAARDKAMMNVFTRELRKSCRWLTTKVLVVSRQTYGTWLPDVEVP